MRVVFNNHKMKQYLPLRYKQQEEDKWEQNKTVK